MNRSRSIHLCCILGVVSAGLFSRSPMGSLLPGFVAIYAGDFLWGLMVFLLFAFVFPKASTWKVAVGSLSFCFAIETSQLYQSDWINAIRATTMGALVLGSHFLWSDLACYAAGVIFGVVGEFTSSAIPARNSSRQSPKPDP